MSNPGTRLTFEWQDAQIEDWNSRPVTEKDILAAVRDLGYLVVRGVTCETTCGGRGLVPSPEAIEAAAKAFNGLYRDNETGDFVQAPWEHDIEDIAAALLAAVDTEET